MTLEETKGVEQTLREKILNLESGLKKDELQMRAGGQTGSSVSASHLHALEQEVCSGGREGRVTMGGKHTLSLSLPLSPPSIPMQKLLKKKDVQIADYEEKITQLSREVETLRKFSEKVKIHTFTLNDT